jgi:carboxyl-terminal processing protease
VKSDLGSIAIAFGALTACVAACALNLAARGRDATSPIGSCTAGRSQDVVLIEQALATIKHDYVDGTDRSLLVQNALHAMASSLDPYSDYLDSAELKESEASDTGTYCGIGIEVTTVGSAMEIQTVFDKSPAALAGLQQGDTIVAIDGQPVETGTDEPLERLRGAAGSEVRLIVRGHSSRAFRPYTLQRKCMPIQTVNAALLERGYGYVRISSFTDATPTDMERALADLSRMNRAPLSGLVLDLRENGGGVFEAGAAVAGDFLDSGVIVTAYGRTPEAHMRMTAAAGDLLHGAPMAVLVNGHSASASEIVAGALKDHARATLVGSRTYGKGTVQSIIPLSKGAIELTTARFFTPSGASIQDRGIVPDILIDRRAHSRGSPTAASDPSERDPEVRIALDVVKQHARPRVAAVDTATIRP